MLDARTRFTFSFLISSWLSAFDGCHTQTNDTACSKFYIGQLRDVLDESSAEVKLWQIQKVRALLTLLTKEQFQLNMSIHKDMTRILYLQLKERVIERHFSILLVC